MLPEPSPHLPAHAKLGPEVKSWVRRLVQTQQIEIAERQLGWWCFHLEEFLRYCRRRGERVEARILARGYFDELRQSSPPGGKAAH